MLSASSACGPGARGIGLTCENVPERHPQVGQRLEKARARSLQSGDSDSDVATSCRFLCKRGRFRRRVPLAAWQPKLGRRCRRNRSPAPAWWGKERTRRARRRARSVHVLSPRFCFAEVLPRRQPSAEQREPGGLVVSVVGSARSLGCSQDLRARSLRMCHKKKGYVQARALQPETSAA